MKNIILTFTIVLVTALNINAQRYAESEDGTVIEVKSFIDVTASQVEQVKNNPGDLIYYDEVKKENFNIIGFWHYNYDYVQEHAIVSEDGKEVRRVIKLKTVKSEKQLMWFVIIMLIAITLIIYSNVRFLNKDRDGVFALASVFSFTSAFAMALDSGLLPDSFLVFTFASILATAFASVLVLVKEIKIYWIVSTGFYISAIFAIISLQIF